MLKDFKNFTFLEKAMSAMWNSWILKYAHFTLFYTLYTIHNKKRGLISTHILHTQFIDVIDNKNTTHTHNVRDVDFARMSKWDENGWNVKRIQKNFTFLEKAMSAMWNWWILNYAHYLLHSFLYNKKNHFFYTHILHTQFIDNKNTTHTQCIRTRRRFCDNVKMRWKWVKC